ncbi:hypothetical protein [Amycolatopsis alkalitolerans]|uniref:hypothetical protein n=1 Tax=Amycolatopsis alkalitolerans TaxID=2547244 RepID=UPI00135891F9|nr:hypothetical protein [Amycolatopsis alkalitolerans]
MRGRDPHRAQRGIAEVFLDIGLNLPEQHLAAPGQPVPEVGPQHGHHEVHHVPHRGPPVPAERLQVPVEADRHAPDRGRLPRFAGFAPQVVEFLNAAGARARQLHLPTTASPATATG